MCGCLQQFWQLYTGIVSRSLCQRHHPPPTGLLYNWQSLSVSTQCQLVSTSINSVSSPSDKNHLVKWLSKMNCFLAVCEGRSRIRAHNKLSDLEAEKLSDLSQYNFKMHQSESSSSYLPCELKSMKILAYWDKPIFLVIVHIKQQTFCS